MAYTPDQLNTINTTREANVNAGKSAYEGAGATPYSASQGLGTITTDTLNGNNTAADLTQATNAYNTSQTNATTNAAGVIGATDAKITNAQKGIQDLLTQQETSASTAKTSATDSLLEKIGLKTSAITDRAAALQTPEFLTKQKATNDAYSALLQSKQAQANEIDAVNKANMTDAGRSAAFNAITNKYALQNANLSVVYDVANRDYQSAITNINSIAQLKMEAVQPYIDYFTHALDSATIDWSNAEKNILAQKISDYKDLQTNAKDVADIYKTLLTNNPDAIANNPTLGPQLSNAKDTNEAYQILTRNGVSLENALDRQYKQAQISNLLADTRKKNSEAGIVYDSNGNIIPAPKQQAQLAQAKGNIDLINTIQNTKFLANAVGPNALSRINLKNQFTGEKTNFIAGVEQLRSQLNLDTLIKAKGQGATFGALSDQELQVLASAATKLGTYAIKNDDGKIVGYNANQKDFKSELDKIANFAKLDYVLKGGSPEDVGALKLPDGTVWTRNSDGTLTQIK